MAVVGVDTARVAAAMWLQKVVVIHVAAVAVAAVAGDARGTGMQVD